MEFEESLDLNMYEMDLRQYDPAIARWTSIDPMTHYSASTYNAFDNNPVFFADPSGADAQTLLNSLWDYTDKEGKKLFNSEEEEFTEEGTVSEDCCGEYIGNYKHKKGPKELNYYRNHKNQKKVVNKAAYKAGVLATKVSGNLGGDNLGYSGAIRHSYWMYLVAVELGPELAEKLGLLHEDFIITLGPAKGKNNLTTRDGKMDVINNAWGIHMAIENPNLDYLEFEELFYKDVKSQNTTIMILDKKTIPQQTLRETIEYRTKRHNEIKKEKKATEHKRLPSIKF